MALTRTQQNQCVIWDFLTLSNDADPSFPTLIAAKAE